MSRRTEMAYKAESPGKSAQHDKAHGFRRYGKCRGCIVKDYVLIRGGLFSERSVFSAAPCVATCWEFGQESAEAIVGEGSHHAGAMETGNELGE
jgi:hypothetical protein